jgi:hypothetical protein
MEHKVFEEFAGIMCEEIRNVLRENYCGISPQFDNEFLISLQKKNNNLGDICVHIIKNLKCHNNVTI